MVKSESEEERARKREIAQQFQKEHGGRSKRGKNMQHIALEGSSHARKGLDNFSKARTSKASRSRRPAWRP